MKKLLAACLLSLTMLSACNKTSGELDNNKAYLFYSQTCPHCHEAREYINKKYSNLEMVQLDVATPQGKDMLFKCAKKFNLGNNIGVPLFCLGDNHLMGWNSSYRIKFDAYIRPFMKK